MTQLSGQWPLRPPSPLLGATSPPLCHIFENFQNAPNHTKINSRVLCGVLHPFFALLKFLIDLCVHTTPCKVSPFITNNDRFDLGHVHLIPRLEGSLFSGVLCTHTLIKNFKSAKNGCKTPQRTLGLILVWFGAVWKFSKMWPRGGLLAAKRGGS